MTTPDEAQALLPEDIERAEKFRRGIGGRYDRDVDQLAAEFARCRLSHSLPGDVGMLRAALTTARDYVDGNHDEGCELDPEFGEQNFDDEDDTRTWHDDRKCTCGTDEILVNIDAALTPSAPDENIVAPAPGSFIDMVQDAQEQGKLLKAGAVQSESECNKCGARYPTAPAGHLHKCGLCSGICSPITPSALSGDAGENYRECVEAAVAPARQWYGGRDDGGDHIYLINNMVADLRKFHAPRAGALTAEEIAALPSHQGENHDAA